MQKTHINILCLYTAKAEVFGPCNVQPKNVVSSWFSQLKKNTSLIDKFEITHSTYHTYSLKKNN